MMRVQYRWTVAKQTAGCHTNEDACKYSTPKGRCAVSDGASESFSSRSWARILVDQFIRKPFIDKEWVSYASARYHHTYDRTEMSWREQGAFDQGSFATLLGLTFDHESVEIVGIGDSLAVKADGCKLQDTFPYSTPDQFRRDPLLLSTVPAKNAQIFESNFRTNWQHEPSSQIYCMTDALGAWLLADRTRMETLSSLTSKTAFTKLINSARETASMRNDDTTLLVIG